MKYQGLKAKVIQVRERPAFKYFMAAFGLSLTMVFAIAFVTNPNLVDFLFMSVLSVLTASYLREIVGKGKV